MVVNLSIAMTHRQATGSFVMNIAIIKRVVSLVKLFPKEAEMAITTTNDPVVFSDFSQALSHECGVTNYT